MLCRSTNITSISGGLLLEDQGHSQRPGKLPNVVMKILSLCVVFHRVKLPNRFDTHLPTLKLEKRGGPQ